MSTTTQKLAFKTKGKIYNYTVTRAPGDPAPAFSGSRGDVYVNTDTSIIWIHLGGHHGWKLADTTVSNRGIPDQAHPAPEVGKEYRLFNTEWVGRTLFYKGFWAGELASSKSRTMEVSPSVVTPSVTTTIAATDHELSTQDEDDDEPPPSPPPAKKRKLNTPEAEPIMADIEPQPRQKVAHSANQFLLDLCLHDQWESSTSSLVESQLHKAKRIFDELLNLDHPIRWLPKEQPTISDTCIIVGPARKHPDGVAPTFRHLVDDLCQAGPNTSYVDSVTNLVEQGKVSIADIWVQQINFIEGESFPMGSRVLCPMDVPFSEKGLLQCRWRCPPFDKGNADMDVDMVGSEDSTSSSASSAQQQIRLHPTTCGTYTIHWRGTTLWLMWPATLENLQKMEPTFTSVPDIELTAKLIRTLEGPEMLFLREEEDEEDREDDSDSNEDDDSDEEEEKERVPTEFAFYIRPNTIYCSLSFTESYQANVCIRESGFLPELEDIMTWATDFLENRLINSTRVGHLEKAGFVQSFKETVEQWKEIGKRFPKHQEEVEKIVGPAERALERALQSRMVFPS
ncbi:hypothetical protein EST38_g3682 [Candolleomyces aberdarensis]|uniref:Uncharacterized protein n=1 Tax=Candolleomyces aberdarensis TaxID=2316362 RepID=A0A4Q2DTH6_9AGAR|nr:hypothetical protein EST38_g3682 [Candolleomyces aberdarensis]